MKYRSRTDIVAQILQTANKKSGVTKTRIMYGAFLSYAQLQEYITILEQNQLLVYDSGQQTYRTAEKGRKFLDIYNQIDQFVTPEQQQAITE
jgi:predicted transcriptional regulator